MTAPSATAQIGVTGLAVMGSNIARNFARNGYTVAVHNRSIAKTDALLAEHGGDGDFVRTETMAEFAAALERPRRALIMVQAGDATDAVIEEIAAVFEPGDIIIDGGNALYTDTIRREASLADRGLLFIGAGISGGEEGALLGPSIMPGGPAKSYEAVGPMLEKVAAQVDGEPGDRRDLVVGQVGCDFHEQRRRAGRVAHGFEKRAQRLDRLKSAKTGGIRR